MTLAKNRRGQTRLITTNFDRIFEKVISDVGLDIRRDIAPLLPVPKIRWNGLVYLHGLLPLKPTGSDLQHLVVSSGDFGLAYLTERWASRFVSEIFRNYSVCFVGYSINDPVIRYMMDALAADRLLGETSPEMFAFGSYSKGKESRASDDWQAKKVTPILYREYKNHTYLHKTLKEWARTYRDGVSGKEMIVAQHASSPPLAPSRSDFAVGRVLWALTDGLAAKQFADLKPIPPLKWLEPLSEELFDHQDLSRFGITANSTEDKGLKFSMIYRPTPYTKSSRMSLVRMDGWQYDWDEVMFQLARWLARHLDDPNLIIWLTKRSGQLHAQLVEIIRNKIEEIIKLEIQDKGHELESIRAASPRGIPSPQMRTLWRLILAGRLKSTSHHYDFYRWLRLIKHSEVTASLRMQLREILTPCVNLSKPFFGGEETREISEPKRIKDIVDWEVVLASDNVNHALRDRSKSSNWQAMLPDLLQDFTLLLRDALDLKKELGGADEKSDSSYMDQPSISEHSQNQYFRDWTALIVLARDAWLATASANANANKGLSIRVAIEWWNTPYPVFKRLALFAAAQTDVIPQQQALDWLFSENCWWMWSVETQREVFRLLIALTPKLDSSQQVELERAILNGPPKEMFKADVETDRLSQITNQNQRLRLGKMQAAGAILGQIANAKMNELLLEYPEWKLASDERDEFPFWMGTGGEWRKFSNSPRRRTELISWLKEQKNTDHWDEDDWRQRCRDDFPTTACALCALAKEGIWLEDRWGQALQAWSEEKLLNRSWRYMASLVFNSPDSFIRELDHGISWWLQAVSKTFEGQEEIFIGLCNRILDLNDEDEIDSEDPVGTAINQPVGQVTEALIQWWYRRNPKDSEGLPDTLKPIFTALCNTNNSRFRHGRVLLAAHVISLFRVDLEWTTENLLSLFSWQHSTLVARYSWEGFLWSPRLYLPLLAAIKQSFLETSGHYDDLGDHARQYASFLTFVALDSGDTFTAKEMATATQNLPGSGLQCAAQALTNALNSAQQQRADYWENRVLPYLHKIWPQSRKLVTPGISEEFSQLCIAAGEMFPSAMAELLPWLVPIEHPDYVVHLLYEAKISEQFPSDALSFLDAVVGDNTQWLPSELQQCLDLIQQADPGLVDSECFVRLAELTRRRGLE